MVWICVSAYGLDLSAVKSMVMGMGAFEGHKRKECIATFLGLDRGHCDHSRFAFHEYPYIEGERFQEL